MHNTILLLAIAGQLYGPNSPAVASESTISLIGRPSARGVALVRITNPTGRLAEMRVRYKGEEWKKVGPGVPRSYHALSATSMCPAGTVRIVPFIIDFSGDDHKFILDRGGRCELQFVLRDDSGELLERVVELDVAPPKATDMRFMSRLRDFDGRRIAKTAPRSDISIEIIGELLQSTRDPDIESIMVRGEFIDIDETAEQLLSVCREIPSSTFTPYAAQYAAKLYLARHMELVQLKPNQEGFRERTNSRFLDLANESLVLLRQSIDPYLQAQSLFLEAIAAMFESDFDKATRILDDESIRMSNDRQLKVLVEKLRREIESITSHRH